MAQKKNSDRITIANIISMIGIVLLLVFTYLGGIYTNRGSMGTSIVIAIAVTAFNGLLLWFMCKAKGAENYLQKWIIAEVAVVVVYIISAIGTTMFCGIPQFFAVNANSDDITNYARNDVAKIDSLFSSFESFENASLGSYKEGLKNAKQDGINKFTDSLKNHLGRHRFLDNLTNERIDAEIDARKNAVIMGKTYQKLKIKKDKLVGEINSSIIDSWNIMTIPTVTNNIFEFADEAEQTLTELSQEGDLAEITKTEHSIYNRRGRIIGKSHKWDIVSYYTSEFKITGGKESLLLHNCINGTHGFSIVGVIVAVLIHIIIMFNYIVVHRTRTLSIGKFEKEDGGIILK